MITPSDPKILNKNFVVVDIENYASKDHHKKHPRDGELIMVGTMWRDKQTGSIEHEREPTWDKWWPWVVDKAKSDSRFRTLWAHNGGGWDWPSLIHWLLHHPSEYTKITGAFGGFRNICCCIYVDDICIKLCDSFLLFRSSLDSLAKQFLGEGKTKTDDRLPHELWEKDKAKFYEYLERDCESLLLVMEKAIELIHTKIAPVGRFGVTVGSTAMDVYRTGFLDREITCPLEKDDEANLTDKRREELANTEGYEHAQLLCQYRQVRPFLRLGYKGGRCEVFNYGRYDDVRVYDINSLYPWAMANTPVPTSDRGVWVKEFVEPLCGCYHIRFRQQRRDIPPVFMVKQSGVYEGSGVYFSPEIKRFREIDPQGEFEVVGGYVFQDNAVIFKSFVETLYQLRLDNPDTPLSLLSKFLMNNLYGKMAQHSGRESLIRFANGYEYQRELDSYEDLRKKKPEKYVPKLTPYCHPSELTFIKSEFSLCKWEHVGIAGMITSSARAKLHEGLCAITGTLLYCDTDSVHVSGRLEGRLVGKALGLFKEEFPDKGSDKSEGIYCGRKLYSLRQFINGNKIEKVRAKGVRVGGHNGFSLDFDGLNHMLATNSVIDTEFWTPDTMRAIWASGKTPNRFQKRKRKIQRT